MEKNGWGISEFASYNLEEDGESFKIIIEGSVKYKWLIAEKIEDIKITEDDLKENDLVE